MNNLRFAALATVIACASFSAHAATDYKASFALDAFPLLQNGNLPDDWPGLLNGGLGSYRNNAEAFIREGRTTTTDPVTGEVVTRWEHLDLAANKGRNDGSNHTFGTSYAPIVVEGLGQAHAGAAVNRYSVSATGTVNTPATADAWANATWNRDFWIEPGTVFTFSGLAQASAVGDLGAATVTRIDGGGSESFVSLLVGDVQGRAWAGIGATLFNGASVQDFISYSASPSGQLSLSFRNDSTERLYGNLNVEAWVNTRDAVAAPVPEPETLAMLAGGLLLVARVARRKDREIAATLV